MFRKKSKSSKLSEDTLEGSSDVDMLRVTCSDGEAKGGWFSKNKVRRIHQIERMGAELKCMKEENLVLQRRNTRHENEIKNLNQKIDATDCSIVDATVALDPVAIEMRGNLNALQMIDSSPEHTEKIDSSGEAESQLTRMVEAFTAVGKDLQAYSKQVMERRNGLACGEAKNTHECTTPVKYAAVVVDNRGETAVNDESNEVALGVVLSSEEEDHHVQQAVSELPHSNRALQTVEPRRVSSDTQHAGLQSMSGDIHRLNNIDLVMRVQQMEQDLGQFKQERDFLTKEVDVAKNFVEMLSDEVESYKKEVIALKQWNNNARRSIGNVLRKLRSWY